MYFFDSHAHLTDQDAFLDIDEVIQEAKKANVIKIINICSDKVALEKGLLLSQKHDCIYTAAATDPHSVEKKGEEFFPIVEAAANNKKIIAIGETGLDYYYEYSLKECQKSFFIKYLQLAKKNNIPVIIHARDAFEDVFKIADEFYQDHKALIHCFTGSEKEATQALERGWYLSFSGIVTYKNNNKLRDVLKHIPLDRILIETDSPLLAPQSKRGKKNEPANLIETAQCIANNKNLSLKKFGEITFENTLRFFSLPK